MIPKGNLIIEYDDADVSDLLASLLDSNHCGCIRLFDGDGRTEEIAAVVIEGGSVVAAVCGDLVGDSALSKIAAIGRSSAGVYQYNDFVIALARRWSSEIGALVRSDEKTIADVAATVPEIDATVPRIRSIRPLKSTRSAGSVGLVGSVGSAGSGKISRHNMSITVTRDDGSPADTDVKVNDVTLHTDRSGRVASWLRAGDHEIVIAVDGFRTVKKTIHLDCDLNETIELLRGRADDVVDIVDVQGVGAVEDVEAVDDPDDPAIDLAYFKQIETEFAKTSADILGAYGISHLIVKKD